MATLILFDTRVKLESIHQHAGIEIGRNYPSACDANAKIVGDPDNVSVNSISVELN